MNKNVDTVINYFKYCVDGKDVARVSVFRMIYVYSGLTVQSQLQRLSNSKSHCPPVWSIGMSPLRPPFKK